MKKILLPIILFMVTSIHSQPLTDYHCHHIPDSYRDLVEKHNATFDEGFPLPQWSAEKHLQLMNDAGITTSILTLPAPHPYWGDIDETKREIRKLNEETAALCKKYHGRFQFCAILPLPNVDAAIAEARYVLDTLGAVGVKLATNVYGQYLGDSVLDPLMEFLSEHHALVILHPHKPTPVNNAVMNQTPLAMQEYLSETTRAVCNMISRDVLARYPNMRVVVPHAGAYLPIALPRMRSLYPVMKQNGLVGEIDFDKNISCLFFDLAGSPTDEVIQSLLSITTRDHLLYGTDLPYVAPIVIKNNKEHMQKHLIGNIDIINRTNIKKDVCDFGNMIVRIAEIEVNDGYLQEYLAAAQKVGTTSVEQESGVICIFPMQIKDKPNSIRIVEIYRDEEAYLSHLKSPHFLEYKSGTLNMVKSLNLITTDPLTPETMPLIFNKIK